MMFAFPHFYSREDLPEKLQKEYDRIRKEQLEAAAQHNLHMIVNEAKRRRYAEDETLNRGSYFSVCTNADGDDGGTMVREMNAYRDPKSGGRTEAFDLNDTNGREALQSLGYPVGDRQKAFAVVIFDPVDFSERNGELAFSTASANSVEKLEYRVIVVPYVVEYFEIERVIDLRKRHVQNWIYRKFRVGDGIILKKPNGTNIRSFFEMMPTLMTPEIGGNEITNAIGLWMRRHDINALVFPSARSDVFVEYTRGEISAFGGWNMVRYTGSPIEKLHKIKQYSDFSPWEFQWTGRFHLCDSGVNIGSWKILGVRDGMDLLYSHRDSRWLCSKAIDMIKLCDLKASDQELLNVVQQKQLDLPRISAIHADGIEVDLATELESFEEIAQLGDRYCDSKEFWHTLLFAAKYLELNDFCSDIEHRL